MAKTKTLTQLAQIIGEADGASDDDIAKIHRNLRNWEKGKVLKPYGRPIDDRGTVVFDEVTACTARLLCVLAKFGLDIGFFRDSMLQIVGPKAQGVVVSRDANGKRISTPYWEPPEVERRHIKNLPAAVRQGEDWKLRIELLNGGPVGHAYQTMSGCFVLPGDPSPTPEENVAVDKFRKSQGLVVQAVLELPASELVKPVVRAFEA